MDAIETEINMSFTVRKCRCSLPIVPSDLCHPPLLHMDLNTSDSILVIFVESISDLYQWLDEAMESENLLTIEAWVQN